MYKPIEIVATPDEWISVQKNPSRSRKRLKSRFDGLEVELAIVRPPDYNPKNKPTIRSSSDCYNIIRSQLESEVVESIIVIIMDNRNRIIGIYVANRGHVEAVETKPVDVLRCVIVAGAPSFILVHNHPSGDVEPSESDLLLTKRVKISSDQLGINMLDHLIVGYDGYISFVDIGLM